tara:strand:- start:695 stop:799 length:105 start_codon:yes stop_codon:yes gene_type:complete
LEVSNRISVTESWGVLPPDTRKAILAIVEATGGG